MSFTLPSHDCALCPRLADFREKNRLKFPDKFNAPVPPFGPDNAGLVIVGLAPGLKGANFTGRPFTGDYAGVLLYSTLLKFGFAEGEFKAHAGDGLKLKNCRITNAVRCVPPENKPLPTEETTCRKFLLDEFSVLKNAKVILSLGMISHNSVLKTFDEKKSAHKFGHGAVHTLKNGLKLVDSYHCSRYNTQTKRLTEDMFHDVFKIIKKLL